MKLYYDLHIHSCLSPCGDDDMTPNNIANMAKLSGLDLIAVTDHNSCRNAPAVINAAKRIGLLALAGMELTTREDVHVLVLFADVTGALEFNDFVDGKRMRIPLRADIYGDQVIMDEFDGVIGNEKDLLINASDVGVYEIAAAAERYGGVALPAHIDRESNGLVSVLGQLSRDMGFTAVEFSLSATEPFMERYISEGYGVLRNSDAHRLDAVGERERGNFLEVARADAESVIKAIRALGKIR